VWLNKSFREWDKKLEEVRNILDDEDEVIEEIRKDLDAPVDAEEKSPDPKFLNEMKKI
jgi:hypothetical protein